MTLRYSLDARNAGVDARIATIGPSPVLKIFSGKAPGSCAEIDPDGLLVTIRLPKQWMGKAKDGAAAKQGIWAGTAIADGKATCFRISDAKGKSHVQGDIPNEMALDDETIRAEQQVSVASFIISSGNA